MALDSVHEHDFVTVTEQSALAAAQTMGCGDPRLSAEAASEALHETLERMGIRGRVVIDTGVPHSALHGTQKSDEEAREEAAGDDAMIDLALDPLEGQALCASGIHGSRVARAASTYRLPSMW